MGESGAARRTADASAGPAAFIPGKAYVSPRVLEAELDRIFARLWVVAGPADDVLERGDHFTVNIGRDSILVVCLGPGEVQAFYNVCRHRGRRLVDAERGTAAAQLTCAFHHWVYDLDGTLAEAPPAPGCPAADVPDCKLVPVQCTVWNGLVFVNLDANAQSLATYLGPLTECLDEKIHPGMVLQTARYDIEANWKVVVQSLMEPAHIDALRPSGPLELDWAQAATDRLQCHSLQVIPSTKAEGWAARRAGTWREWMADPRYLECHYTMFPNVSVHVFIPGLTFVFRCLPHATDPAHTTLDCWVWARVRAGRPVPDSAELEEHDVEIPEEAHAQLAAVQQGVQSRGYPGPSLTSFDDRIGHFYAAYREQLAADTKISP